MMMMAMTMPALHISNCPSLTIRLFIIICTETVKDRESTISPLLLPCHVRKPPMVKKLICQSVNYVPTLKVDILELQPNYILTPNHSRNTLAHILYPFGNSDYVKNLNRKKSWNFITSCTRMNTADITGEDPNNWDARSIRVFIHWLLAILDWNWKSPTSRIFRSWNDNEWGKPRKNCKFE